MVAFTIAACVFTVLAMALSLYSIRTTSRAKADLSAREKALTAERVAAQAARIEEGRLAAKDRVELRQAMEAHVAAAWEAAKQSKRYAFLRDEMLAPLVDPGSREMAVTTGEDEDITDPMIEGPHTLRGEQVAQSCRVLTFVPRGAK